MTLRTLFFNASFMQFQPSYFNYRPIFNELERKNLNSLASSYPLSKLLSDRRRLVERSIDYAYVSAKMEHNPYSRKGAAMLLKHSFTEGGKRLDDAWMLINLRDAFIDIVSPLHSNVADTLTTQGLARLHCLAMNHLLNDNELGVVRTVASSIVGSAYKPISSPGDLKNLLTTLLKNANSIENPFEQAVYVHCNLAYLQFFHDGNKRTARLMQTAILVANKITPVFFSEDAVYPYLNAIVTYYETGDYSLYKTLFLEEYENTIKHLLGQSPEQLRAQQLANESIQSQKIK